MTILHSARLRHNYLLLEVGEHPSVDEVLHTALLHRCDRICCGGRTKIALARKKANGTQENERFVPKAALQRYL